MAKRKGNPTWGKPGPFAEEKPTRFELKAQELGLTEDKWAFDVRLKAWAKKNCNRVWVPEHLIFLWGFERYVNCKNLGGLKA